MMYLAQLVAEAVGDGGNFGFAWILPSFLGQNDHLILIQVISQG